jgi:hypothetical protein
MKKLIILNIIGILILFSCTTRDNNIKDGTEEDNIVKGSEITGTIVPPEEASDWEIEELDETDFVVEGTIGDIKDDWSSTDETPVYGDDEIVSGSLNEPKYRVQVLAVTSKTNADDFASEVMGLLPEQDVVVQKIGEWWKVRVGNCSTKTEAEQLKDKLQNLGYSDAWIVSP